jgi:hypothetical protein
MIRFHLSSFGQPKIFGDVNVDYDINDRSAQLAGPAESTPAVWDHFLWDHGLWAADLTNYAEWQGASGIGYTFAPLLKTSSLSSQLQWTATDMSFEPAGVL